MFLQSCIWQIISFCINSQFLNQFTVIFVLPLCLRYKILPSVELSTALSLSRAELAKKKKKKMKYMKTQSLLFMPWHGDFTLSLRSSMKTCWEQHLSTSVSLYLGAIFSSSIYIPVSVLCCHFLYKHCKQDLWLQLSMGVQEGLKEGLFGGTEAAMELTWPSAFYATNNKKKEVTLQNVPKLRLEGWQEVLAFGPSFATALLSHSTRLFTQSLVATVLPAVKQSLVFNHTPTNRVAC